MALRTYGDKPLSFQLEEGGEYYYVGSEVSAFCPTYNGYRESTKQYKIKLTLIMSFRSVIICDYFVDRCTRNTRACHGAHSAMKNENV